MGISSWQTELQSSIHQYEDLTEACGLNSDESYVPQPDFPVKVPMAYLSRINAMDPADPLLLQVLPTLDEEREAPGFQTDAVGEFNKHLTPGLIQKYHGRALLITTASCAIHCRYCFRRHYPYPENHAGHENWAKAIDTLQADSSISEIILSGGDPLSLADAKLEKLIGQLENVVHLKFLRIHTRFPVAVPSRVTRELLDILNRSRFKTTVVVHINHANEIDKAVGHALNNIHQSGIQLLNQSVLLKGINDKAEVLIQLSEDLYSRHVLPYYLHLLDPVQGAAHFDVDENLAKDLIIDMRARLPGYLVPKLVKETPDAPYKIPVD